MYESDAQATIEAMLDLSLSLDLAHPFPMGLAGPCDAQPSPTTPAWQFAAKPLEQAVSTQIAWKNARTQSVRSLNKTGNYYCWNRTYDPSTASWTTPDPAMTPWYNTSAYAAGYPVDLTDPSGLGVTEIEPGTEGLKFGTNPTIKSEVNDGHFVLRYVWDGKAGDYVIQDVDVKIELLCDKDKMLEYLWSYKEWFKLNDKRAIDAREINLGGVLAAVNSTLRGEGWEGKAGDAHIKDRRVCEGKCCLCEKLKLCVTADFTSWTAKGVKNEKVIDFGTAASFGVLSQTSSLKLCGKTIPIDKIGTSGVRKYEYAGKDVSGEVNGLGDKVASHRYKLCADIDGAIPTAKKDDPLPKLKNHTSSGLDGLAKGVVNK
ncbi:MAG: hypothetical protein M5U25_20785 [Planctomycetota bacterium]|nr:hypothetical protein [Planctomycetota bacterium]